MFYFHMTELVHAPKPILWLKKMIPRGFKLFTLHQWLSKFSACEIYSRRATKMSLFQFFKTGTFRRELLLLPPSPPRTPSPFILMQVQVDQCFEKYCSRVSKGSENRIQGSMSVDRKKSFTSLLSGSSF